MSRIDPLSLFYEYTNLKPDDIANEMKKFLEDKRPLLYEELIEKGFMFNGENITIVDDVRIPIVI